jgi:hypothetical protein
MFRALVISGIAAGVLFSGIATLAITSAQEPSCEVSLNDLFKNENPLTNKRDEVVTWDFNTCPSTEMSFSAWSARGKLTLKATIDENDNIHWIGGRKTKSGQFRLYPYDLVNRDEIDPVPVPSVTWEHLVVRRTKQTFSWSAKVNGQVFAKGKFRARVKAYRVGHNRRAIPDRKVWQFTDEFFNYCIKKGKELFSEGGRLYCWKPGRAGSERYSLYYVRVKFLSSKDARSVTRHRRRGRLHSEQPFAWHPAWSASGNRRE